MIRWFIIHQWKQATRSNIWQKNLAANIAIGFMVFLMFLYLLALGIFIEKILSEAFPDNNPVVMFNSGLFYYFAFDLLFRYLMQPLPTLTVEHYRHLPVKNNLLVNYVVNKSLLNVTNLIPLLVFIPFAIKAVGGYYSSSAALFWLLGMWLMIIANNYLAMLLKRMLTGKPLIVAAVGGFLVALILLDYYHLISLTSLSSEFFGLFISKPISIFIPLLWVALTYYLNFNYLKKRLYPEEISRKKRKTVDRLSRVKYFEGLGLTGSIMMLEMKLWWRHKRTRSMLFMMPIFLLYGLIFYTQEPYEDATAMLIFVGVFMSGGMMINYLNYAFGYESNYFDAILTKEIDLKSYIRAKFMIGILFTTICFVLITPYAFFGWQFFLINTAAFLFNIGFLSYVLLYMSTFNKKRMDLSKGATFNYQGVGAMNWLAMIPAFLLPIIIYTPFGLTGNKYAGLLAISLLGILGFLFQKPLINMIYNNLKERKYVMAEGFRE